MPIEPEAFSILRKVDQFLEERRIEAYLVGGFVRDSIIGRSTADIDLAIDADVLKIAPEIAGSLGGRYVLLDDANRIARIVLPGEKWYLDLSTLAGDIYRDLARRDFTINAMAVHLKSLLDNSVLEILDPFKGQLSLKQREITAVNDLVFTADPARLLRASRLAAELGFHVTPETETLIKHDCQLIVKVAGERVREELLRILATPEAGRIINQLDEFGLLPAIIPELEPARGIEQPEEHHWDVLNHSLKTVQSVGFLLRQSNWEYASASVLKDVPWSEKLSQHFAAEVSSGSNHASLLKLAALLHDIAKPETKIIDKERIRFFGHTEQGAEIVAGILERLRFSNKEIKLIQTMVRYHLRPTQMSQTGMPTRRAIYRYFRDTGSAAIDILFLSLADHLAARGPDLDVEQWKWHTGQSKCILTDCFKQENIIFPPKLIDGHDLINLFGLKPGPEIRGILEVVREAQAAGEITTRDEALNYIRNRL